MGVTVGPDHQKWLFSIVFVVMLAAVPVFGWVVAHVSRRYVLPVVYLFFIANLLLFWIVIGGYAEAPIVAGAFFVWVSVFNLFVVSLFWSFLADHFTSDQAKRLYGFVTAGGSLGVLAGASLTNGLVHAVGVPGLLLLSAGILVAALICALFLERMATPSGDVEQRTRAGLGTILSGAVHCWRDPYLFRIALWVLLANLVGTYFYIEEQRIVRAVLTVKADQVAYFSSRDRIVSLLQLLSQFFLTGYLLRRFGIGPCAAALPVSAVIGLLALWLAPGLTVVWLVMIAERATAFGLSNPATRVLWTVVSADDKYKAQNFVDTVVFRGGDVASAWAVNGLTQTIRLPMAGVALLTLPFALAWVALTFQLARKQDERAGRDTPARSSS